MQTITKGEYLGLNYEIVQNNKDSFCYSIYDLGKITNAKIELGCGSSCRNEFTIDYIKTVIEEILKTK